MKSLDSVDNVKESFRRMKSRSALKNPMISDEISKKRIEECLTKIKKDGESVYDKPPEFFSSSDRESFCIRTANAMSGMSNSLTSRDIMLLAWNASSIGIVKRGSDYFPLTRSSIKLFAHPVNPASRFLELVAFRGVDLKKIITGLLVSYLDDYRNTSSTYKNLLFRLLKKEQYCNDRTIKMYFNGNLILNTMLLDRREFSVTIRLASMGFKYRAMSTKFFIDLWSFWMFRYANFEEDKNLREFTESWYAKNCTANQMKMIVAKALNDFCIIDRYNVKRVFEKYMFPSISRFGGFDFILNEEFWTINESLYEIFYYVMPEVWSTEKILKNAFSVIVGLYREEI